MGPEKNPSSLQQMASDVGSLRYEVIQSVVALSEDELLIVRQSIRLTSLKKELEGVNMIDLLPGDAIACIGSFLDASAILSLGAASKSTRDALDILWKGFGESAFTDMLVEGVGFSDDNEVSSWQSRYLEFCQAMTICPRRGVVKSVGPREVRTCIPLYRKATCTLPAMFSVLSSGRTFLELTVSVKFSPDAVRSVIGLIGSPITSTESLQCDRGLSRQHWGLAFGPLTGVVSSSGRYFDDFSTYRARHGLHDYLSRALEEEVELKVGIFINNSMIAFYRLPEQDYVDWECTGFVYQVPICKDPPYYPHTNETALRQSSWHSFAEEGLNLVSPPPNTPVLFSSEERDLVEVTDL